MKQHLFNAINTEVKQQLETEAQNY